MQFARFKTSSQPRALKLEAEKEFKTRLSKKLGLGKS